MIGENFEIFITEMSKDDLKRTYHQGFMGTRKYNKSTDTTEETYL